MSVFRYNNVNLSFTNTLSVNQGPELDPSGTDVLFTRTTLRVRAVIGPGLYPAVVGEEPSETLERITHLLTTPRRALYYAPGDGAEPLIDIADGRLDDNNGPMPDRDAFSIDQITPGSFLVTFAVTTWLVRCTGSASRPYLSLRWAEGTTTDAKWLTVKRRHGLLIVSSRGTNGPVNPDDLRGLVTPDVPQGFRRESADYQLDESGLRLRFSFVDRQLARAIPEPMLSVRGRQIESVPLRGGLRRGHLSLKVSGPPGVEKRDLLNAAIRIGMSRVYASDPQRTTDKAGRIMLGGAISESLDDDENAVELSLEWNMKPAKSREGGKKPPAGLASLVGGLGPIVGVIPGFGAVLGGGRLSATTPEGKPQDALPVYAGWVGTPFPDTDPARGIAPPTRGLADWVRLVAAVLNDPCGQTSDLRAGDEPNQWVGTTTDGAVLTAGVGNVLPPDDEAALYTDEDGPGVWDHWTCVARYDEDTGYDVLPPTGSETGAGKVGKKVKMYGRLFTLRFEWSYKRIGGKPAELPHPAEDADENWVYVSGQAALDNLDTASDGVSIVYGASGYWVYKALDPSKVSLLYPIPPFLERSLLQEPAKLAELRGDSDRLPRAREVFGFGGGGGAGYPSA